MNHKVYLLLVIVFIFLFTNINGAKATVGGSLTLYDLRYNPVDQSIYYIVSDGGGRGCPPVLKKKSLIDGSVQTVFSCDQGEELMGGNWEDRYLVNRKINDITKDFKALEQISLKRNNFDIDVNFLKGEFMEGENEFLIRRIYSADIYQNKKLIDNKEVPGCDLEEPFLFDGYAIPGFNQKIILLMSAKADCFEGGYVSDSLYVVGNVSNLSKDIYVNTYKSASPIQPSKHTLIVYEDKDVTLGDMPVDDEDAQIVDGNMTEDASPDYKKIILPVLISSLTLIIGFFLGRLVYFRKET